MKQLLAGSFGLTLSATGAPIVLDDDGDRDFAAGPNVTTVNVSINHNNGGWGSGSQYFNQTNAYNGDGPTFNGGAPGAGAVATYTFDASLGVVAGSTYNVYATWAQEGQVNAGPAVYNVSDGLGDVPVDMKLPVGGDLRVADPFVGDSKKFQLLGQITEDGDGVITITLTNDGANYFIVDAVAIAPPPLSWDPADDDNGGAGNWNTTDLSWQFAPGTSPNGAWAPNDGTQTAAFGGGGGVVTLIELISVGELSIGSTGYSFTGSTLMVSEITATEDATISSALAGTSPLGKSGGGTLSLTGDGSGFTDTLTVSGGRFNMGGPLGGSVVVEDGSTLGGEAAITSDLQLGTIDGNGASLAVDVDTDPGALGTANLALEGVTSLVLEGTLVFGTPIPIVSYSGTLTDNSGEATLNDAFTVTPSYRKTVTDNAGTLELTLLAPESSTWDNGFGSGFWAFGDIDGDANWTSTDSFFYGGDSVTFDDTAPGTVTLDNSLGALEPASVTFANTGVNDVILTGSPVGGSGGLAVNGTGTVVFEGENSYTGGTVVNDGVLDLNETTGVGNGTGAVRGEVTVNGPGVLRLSTDNALGWGGGVKVDTLNINGGSVHTTATGDNGWGITINMTGGELGNDGNGTGYYSFGSGSAVNTLPSAETAVVSAIVRLREGNPDITVPFAVEDGAAATDLLISGVIEEQNGAWGITKTGDGTMSLTGANTYTGSTIVEGGVLAVNGTSIDDGSSLVIDGGVVEASGTEVVDTLFFGVTQQANGTWGATDSGADNIDDTNFSGTAGVVLVGALGYDAWAGGFPGFTNTDPEVDFENDGLESGIEWVVGGDPTANDAAGIAPTFDNTTDPDDFLFIFRRTLGALDDPDTTIVVQYGSDLTGWTPAEDGVDGVTISEDIDGAGTDIDLVTVAIPRALAADGKLFARLNVTVAP